MTSSYQGEISRDGCNEVNGPGRRYDRLRASSHGAEQSELS
jgi:hypothetical protein